MIEACRDGGDRGAGWHWVVLVAFAVAVCFLPALTCGFVNWDDDVNFVGNPRYRGLGAEHLRWAFTAFHNGHYVPLTWLSHGVDYLLWEMDPRGYHAQNLLWHVLNSVLVFALAQDLIRRAAPGLLRQSRRANGACLAAGALFFALHPLRVESVAWVTERRDVLSAFFYLLTVLFYLRWHDSRQQPSERWWPGACLAALTCSLMAKAWGITLPVALLILDVYPLGRLRGVASPVRELGRLVARKSPFFLLAFVCAAFAFIAQRRSGLYVVSDYGLSRRVAQASYGLVFYLWKTVFPGRLSPLYLLDPDFKALSLPILACAVAVCAVTALAVWKRKQWPWILSSWFLYIVTVSPVIGISQSGRQIVADRYSYLSMLPVAVLVAAGLLRLQLFLAGQRSGSRVPAVLGLAAVSVLCLLGSLTWRQALVWQDSFALWDQVIRVEPDGYFGYNQRGNAYYFGARDLERAMADYETCLRLNSEFALAYYNRGNGRRERGDRDGALADYSEAIRVDPEFAFAYGNRGALRVQAGDVAGALADYNQAIRYDPNSVTVYSNRALLLGGLGRAAAAIRDCTTAVRLDPGQAETYNTRGLLYKGMGLLRQAERDYTAAIRVDSTCANAHTNRGSARQRRGDISGALADYAAAIAIDSGAEEAYVNRAGLLSQQGDGEGALRDYRQALEHAPPQWPYRQRVERLVAELEGGLRRRN